MALSSGLIRYFWVLHIITIAMTPKTILGNQTPKAGDKDKLLLNVIENLEMITKQAPKTTPVAR